MNLAGITRDFVLGTLSSLLAAFLIWVLGSLSARRPNGTPSLFSFHLADEDAVNLPETIGSSKLRIHPALVIVAACLAFVASLGSLALPSETILPDPNALLFQANNLVFSAQGQAGAQISQAQEDALRMVSNAENGIDPLAVAGGGTGRKPEGRTRKKANVQIDTTIVEEAKRIGDQRIQWAQELGRKNIEEANKSAGLLRAQAEKAQAEIDRNGHTKKNYFADFLNTLLFGILLIGFLGMAAKSIGISVHNGSGYLAASIIVISFSLAATISRESDVLKSCEALMIAATLFVSSRQNQSTKAVVLNAFRILSQRVVPAVKAFVVCNLVAAVSAILIGGILHVFTILLARPTPAVFFNPSVNYWRSQLLDILNTGNDLVLGFLGAFFSCIVGALFLSSLHPENQPLPAPLSAQIDSPPLYRIVYRSFYSRSLYSDGFNLGGIGGPKYLLLLVVLVSVPELLEVQAKFNKFLDSEAMPFAKQITPLEIADDGASPPDDDVTYRLRTSPGGRVLALINPGENGLEPGDRDSLVDLYRDALVLRFVGIPIFGWTFADEQGGTLTAGQGLDITIETEDLAVWIRMARRWLILAISPFWTVCSYLRWLTFCVLLAWVGPLFCGSRRRSSGFHAALRVATIAATPGVLVELIMSPFNLEISLTRTVLVGVCLVYFCIGLSSVNDAPTVPDIRDAPQPISA